MTNEIKGFFGAFRSGGKKTSSDFSDFFSKSSGHKAKVIRQVLREANAEQRRVVQECRETN